METTHTSAVEETLIKNLARGAIATLVDSPSATKKPELVGNLR